MTARRRRPERSVMPRAEQMAPLDDHEQRVRAIEALPDPGRFVGIVYPSTEPVETADDAGGWFLVIPEDLHDSDLVHAAAAVYTPGTAVAIQIRNVSQAVDMLSTQITIDSGLNSSYASAVEPVINEATSGVVKGDIIVVDVNADGGAVGLDVILAFV